MTAGTGARQDNIDLLRALAIVAVIAYHYTSRFPPSYYFYDDMPIDPYVGRHGVDLFFVVSGFCVLMTLDRSERLERFWAQRIARIQPGYVAGVVLTFLVVTAFGLPGREVSVWAAISNLVWLEFLPSIPMVDGAYWSLLVELKFYFWIGLIYYLMKGRNISLAWAGFSAAGLLLWYADLAGLPFGSVLASGAKFLLLAPYAPIFLVGLIAYEAERMSRLRTALLLLLAIVLVTASPRFFGMELVGLAICAFGYVVLKMPWLRVHRAITSLGLISFSLYVVHQNIGLVLIRELAPLIPAAIPRALVAAALMVLLAAAMFKTLELRWQKPLGRVLEGALNRLIGLFPLPKRRGRVEDLPSVQQW